MCKVKAKHHFHCRTTLIVRSFLKFGREKANLATLVFKAYFCAFHLRMRGPWYATKRLFASLATANFRKICRGPHGQKHKYGMEAPHRAN